jgi:ribonuclease III
MYYLSSKRGIMLNENNSGEYLSHIDEDRIKDLEKFQDSLNIKFNDIELFNTAFAHRSYVNELPIDIENNEKLEFLGDSVLALIVNEYLYKNYPDSAEGQLAKIKSIIVSEQILAAIARKIDLGKYILLGKGEQLYGGAERDTILSDTLEAIFGAYYIDRGLEESRKFILPYILEELEKVDKDDYEKDYKSELQLVIQQKYKSCPVYETVKEEGPDHNKIFYVNVIIEGRRYGMGKGYNKKSAQQKAAKEAMRNFKEENEIKE